MESILGRALEYTLKYWLKSFTRDQFKLHGHTVHLSNLGKPSSIIPTLLIKDVSGISVKHLHIWLLSILIDYNLLCVVSGVCVIQWFVEMFKSKLKFRFELVTIRFVFRYRWWCFAFQCWITGGVECCISESWKARDNGWISEFELLAN